MPFFYEKQLEFIRYLHQFSTPWLDDIFKFLNYFDRPEFLFVLIPIVWIGYHWKPGLRLFYILMLSGIVNIFLKQLIIAPRPFHLDPSVGLIEVEGFGIPSGAAQTVILLSGILLNSVRKRWAWILCINYVFWISLSRVYLGVHFPSDILGGWIIGLLLWALYTYGRPPFEKWLVKLSLLMRFLLSQLIPLLLWAIVPKASRLIILTLTVGMGICLAAYFKILLSIPKNRKIFLFRSLIGVAGTFFFAFISENLWQPFLIGLWLSFGANLVFYRNR